MLSSIMDRCCRLSRPQMHLELVMSNTEMVVWQKGRPADTLAIDARTVGTSQITQQQQTIRLDDHTMHFGNALVIETQITLFLPPDQREVFGDLDGRTALE